MGQYYRALLIDEYGDYERMVPWSYGNGAKLMEHSYIGNDFMNAVLSQIRRNPLRVAWIGDYSDEYSGGDVYETKLPHDQFMHYYRIAHPVDEDEVPPPIIAPCSHSVASQGWFLVNHTQKLALDLDAYIAQNKWLESWRNGKTGETVTNEMCVHPLSLLTACGNDRGGGDYHAPHPDSDKVGSWAFDEIEFTDVCPAGFAPVSYRFTEQV